MFRRTLLVLALAGALLVPQKGTSQTLLTPDVWHLFRWNVPFFATTPFPIPGGYIASTSYLWVVDCCVVGDMFEVFQNGHSLGTTSYVLSNADALGIWTPASDPFDLFAGNVVSSGQFYTIPNEPLTLSLVQAAAGWQSGSGYIMSSSVPISVPETESVFLLATGLLGLCFVGWRRRRET